MRRDRAAFTLVELLVVITIIAALVGMIVPAVNAVRALSMKAKCSNNLSQIMKAMVSYESLYRVFPPGRVGCDCSKEGVCANAKGAQRTGTSGFVLILPQLDDPVLYENLGRFQKGAVYPDEECSDGTTSGWDQSDVIKQALQARPPIFVCPVNRTDPVYYDGKRTAPVGSYAMCLGAFGPSKKKESGLVSYKNNGMFVYRFPKSTSDLSSATQTIMLGEVRGGSMKGFENRWMMGVALADCLRSTEEAMNTPDEVYLRRRLSPEDGYRGTFGSFHTGGANFAFGDGHCEFINDDVDLETYQALSVRNRTRTIQWPP